MRSSYWVGLAKKMATRAATKEELREAIRNGDEDKAMTLLNNTEKPGEIRYSGNWTLLHHAAWHGRTALCQVLVEQYQVPLEEKDRYGWTALYRACLYNHTDTVKYLVTQAHCDPFIKDKYGYTPLSTSEGETSHFLEDIIG